MRPRFIHLTVHFLGANRTPYVDGVLDALAPDWVRYTPNTWILWTDKTTQYLTDVIRPLLMDASFLLLPVDMSQNAQGFAPQHVWDWMNRPRDSGWTPPSPTNERLFSSFFPKEPTAKPGLLQALEDHSKKKQ